ncbi:MAG: bifunctional DNA-formamidopyrimidine glycosylase/DNA-(apurinic or apyrimidinic site) lyase [Chloroflexi bacterium]|nr:bifunctional DNA-formamidopyrimidine glycosylase/DNA-(apurinic or apyrimidinic site) lyase [Chloroflexota bacterium]
MPELPEVETTARSLRTRIIGRQVASVGAVDWPAMLPNATGEALNDALSGRVVTSVGRRGKYQLIGMDDGATLVIHRKMSGNLLLRAPDAPLARHTHLALNFDDGTRLDYVDPRKFGRIYYFPDDASMQEFLDERLGPEPLEIGRADFERRLSRRRGRLKPLLLDQHFLAGIGNMYADEILWEARLHPERSAESLSPRERGRLLTAIRSVLTAAIGRRGTSFSDYRDATGEPGENQNFLRVYGRAGQPCPRCGHPIERLVIGQRGTWLCPYCQRRSRE